MRMFVTILLCLFSISANATLAGPLLIFKNQFGEQTNASIIANGSTFFLATPAALQAAGLIPASESIIAAGALSVSKMESKVSNVTSGSYAVTLAAPAASADGQVKIVLAVATMTHTVTLACTNIVFSGAYTPTGTTTLTFTSAGQSAIFIAVGAKWVYVGGSAVAS